MHVLQHPHLRYNVERASPTGRIPDCRVVMQEEDCVVIADAMVEGTHQPSQVSLLHFIEFFLRNKLMVGHGDIA